jgi:hypothetical protein
MDGRRYVVLTTGDYRRYYRPVLAPWAVIDYVRWRWAKPV